MSDVDYGNFYGELYPGSMDLPLFNIHLNVDYPFNLTGILPKCCACVRFAAPNPAAADPSAKTVAPIICFFFIVNCSNRPSF